MVLLQFSWRRGAKDSRGPGFKGLFFNIFIRLFYGGALEPLEP